MASSDGDEIHSMDPTQRKQQQDIFVDAARESEPNRYDSPIHRRVESPWSRSFSPWQIQTSSASLSPWDGTRRIAKLHQQPQIQQSKLEYHRDSFSTPPTIPRVDNPRAINTSSETQAATMQAVSPLRIRGGGEEGDNVRITLILTASSKTGDQKKWSREILRTTNTFQEGVQVSQILMDSIRENTRGEERESGTVIINGCVSIVWAKGEVTFHRNPTVIIPWDDSVRICESLQQRFEEMTDKIAAQDENKRSLPNDYQDLNPQRPRDAPANNLQSTPAPPKSEERVDEFTSAFSALSVPRSKPQESQEDDFFSIDSSMGGVSGASSDLVGEDSQHHEETLSPHPKTSSLPRQISEKGPTGLQSQNMPQKATSASHPSEARQKRGFDSGGEQHVGNNSNSNDQAIVDDVPRRSHERHEVGADECSEGTESDMPSLVSSESSESFDQLWTTETSDFGNEDPARPLDRSAQLEKEKAPEAPSNTEDNRVDDFTKAFSAMSSPAAVEIKELQDESESLDSSVASLSSATYKSDISKSVFNKNMPAESSKPQSVGKEAIEKKSPAASAEVGGRGILQSVGPSDTKKESAPKVRFEDDKRENEGRSGADKAGPADPPSKVDDFTAAFSSLGTARQTSSRKDDENFSVDSSVQSLSTAVYDSDHEAKQSSTAQATQNRLGIQAKEAADREKSIDEIQDEHASKKTAADSSDADAARDAVDRPAQKTVDDSAKVDDFTKAFSALSSPAQPGPRNEGMENDVEGGSIDSSAGYVTSSSTLLEQEVRPTESVKFENRPLEKRQDKEVDPRKSGAPSMKDPSTPDSKPDGTLQKRPAPETNQTQRVDDFTKAFSSLNTPTHQASVVENESDGVDSSVGTIASASFQSDTKSVRDQPQTPSLPKEPEKFQSSESASQIGQGLATAADTPRTASKIKGKGVLRPSSDETPKMVDDFTKAFSALNHPSVSAAPKQKDDSIDSSIEMAESGSMEDIQGKEDESKSKLAEIGNSLGETTPSAIQDREASSAPKTPRAEPEASGKVDDFTKAFSALNSPSHGKSKPQKDDDSSDMIDSSISSIPSASIRSELTESGQIHKPNEGANVSESLPVENQNHTQQKTPILLSAEEKKANKNLGKGSKNDVAFKPDRDSANASPVKTAAVESSPKVDDFTRAFSALNSPSNKISQPTEGNESEEDIDSSVSIASASIKHNLEGSRHESIGSKDAAENHGDSLGDTNCKSSEKAEDFTNAYASLQAPAQSKGTTDDVLDEIDSTLDSVQSIPSKSGIVSSPNKSPKTADTGGAGKVDDFTKAFSALSSPEKQQKLTSDDDEEEIDSSVGSIESASLRSELSAQLIGQKEIPASNRDGSEGKETNTKADDFARAFSAASAKQEQEVDAGSDGIDAAMDYVGSIKDDSDVSDAHPTARVASQQEPVAKADDFAKAFSAASSPGPQENIPDSDSIGLDSTMSSVTGTSAISDAKMAPSQANHQRPISKVDDVTNAFSALNASAKKGGLSGYESDGIDSAVDSHDFSSSTRSDPKTPLAPAEPIVKKQTAKADEFTQAFASLNTGQQTELSGYESDGIDSATASLASRKPQTTTKDLGGERGTVAKADEFANAVSAINASTQQEASRPDHGSDGIDSAMSSIAPEKEQFSSKILSKSAPPEPRGRKADDFAKAFSAATTPAQQKPGSSDDSEDIDSSVGSMASAEILSDVDRPEDNSAVQEASGKKVASSTDYLIDHQKQKEAAFGGTSLRESQSGVTPGLQESNLTVRMNALMNKLDLERGMVEKAERLLEDLINMEDSSDHEISDPEMQNVYDDRSVALSVEAISEHSSVSTSGSESSEFESSGQFDSDKHDSLGQISDSELKYEKVLAQAKTRNEIQLDNHVSTIAEEVPAASLVPTDTLTGTKEQIAEDAGLSAGQIEKSENLGKLSEAAPAIKKNESTNALAVDSLDQQVAASATSAAPPPEQSSGPGDHSELCLPKTKYYEPDGIDEQLQSPGEIKPVSNKEALEKIPGDDRQVASPATQQKYAERVHLEDESSSSELSLESLSSDSSVDRLRALQDQIQAMYEQAAESSQSRSPDESDLQGSTGETREDKSEVKQGHGEQKSVEGQSTKDYEGRADSNMSVSDESVSKSESDAIAFDDDRRDVEAVAGFDQGDDVPPDDSSSQSSSSAKREETEVLEMPNEGDNGVATDETLSDVGLSEPPVEESESSFEKPTLAAVEDITSLASADEDVEGSPLADQESREIDVASKGSEIEQNHELSENKEVDTSPKFSFGLGESDDEESSSALNESSTDSGKRFGREKALAPAAQDAEPDAEVPLPEKDERTEGETHAATNTVDKDAPESSEDESSENATSSPEDSTEAEETSSEEESPSDSEIVGTKGKAKVESQPLTDESDYDKLLSNYDAMLGGETPKDFADVPLDVPGVHDATSGILFAQKSKKEERQKSEKSKKLEVGVATTSGKGSTSETSADERENEAPRNFFDEFARGKVLPEPAGYKPDSSDYGGSIYSSDSNVSVVSVKSDLTHSTGDFETEEVSEGGLHQERLEPKEDFANVFSALTTTRKVSTDEDGIVSVDSSKDRTGSVVSVGPEEPINLDGNKQSTVDRTLEQSYPFDESPVTSQKEESHSVVNPPTMPAFRSNLQPGADHAEQQCPLEDPVEKLSNVTDAFERLNRLKDRLRGLRLLMDAQDKCLPAKTAWSEEQAQQYLHASNDGGVSISGALADFSREFRTISTTAANGQNPSVPSPIDEAYGSLVRAQAKLRSLRALAKARGETR